MKRLLHKMAHFTGWNRGTVVAATDRKGLVWVAYRCTCGRITSKGIAMTWLKPSADREFR